MGKLDVPCRAELFIEEYLTFTKGQAGGKWFKLEKWQKKLLRRIYNDLDEEGFRRVRTFYCSVPRKNGKTELAAAVGLFHLLSEGEKGAVVVCAAKSRDQAKLVFNAARIMVEQSPELSSLVQLFKTSMEYKGNVLHTISYDAYTGMGLNPSCVICDELHIWEGEAGREFFEMLVSAQGARHQPLTFIITTAGVSKYSVCYEQDQYAQKVADGTLVDTTFASYIKRADPEEDWTAPETWRKANPNLGVSVYEKFIHAEVERAKNSPSQTNKVLRFYLNQWTESTTKYINDANWDACAFPVDPELLKGRRCYGGLDLANTTDLAAFVLTFPSEDEDEPNQVLPFFWIPADNIHDRVMRDGVKYDQWVKDGYIFTTEGNIIDHQAIIKKILELSEIYNIAEIAFDRWGSVQISNQLQGEGVEMVQFGQGFQSMASPTKHLETLTLSKQLAHGGHPVLAWCISNLTVEMDAAGNVKPSKKASSERIDGAVALIMSLDSALVDDPTARPFSFEEMYEAFDDYDRINAEEENTIRERKKERA